MKSDASRSRAAIAAALTVSLLFLAGAAACPGGSAPPVPARGAEEPGAATRVDVRGKIGSMRFQPDDSGVTLLVEGEKEADTGYDKASVGTQENVTRLFRRRPDGSREPITMMSFRLGQTVEATFTGPVAESYPVQATAAEIIIVGEK